jgi:hypothetical protein
MVEYARSEKYEERNNSWTFIPICLDMSKAVTLGEDVY